MKVLYLALFSAVTILANTSATFAQSYDYEDTDTAIATETEDDADTVSMQLPAYTPAHYYNQKITGYGDKIDKQGAMVDTEQSAFIQGSYLSLSLGSAYFCRDYKSAVKDLITTEDWQWPPDWEQLGTGAMLDWLSGYADGWLGLNTSLYGGLRLHASGPGPEGGMLRGSPPNFETSYGRVGRLNIKFHQGNASSDFILHAGLVGVENEYFRSTLLSPEPRKLTPASMRGLTVKSNIGMLQIYGAWLDRLASRSGNGYEHFKNSLGNSIDYVGMIGAAYRLPVTDDGQEIFLNTEYSVGSSYLKTYFYQMTYTLPLDKDMNMLLNGQYYRSEEAGDLWTNGFNTGRFVVSRNNDMPFTDDAQLYNVNLTMNINRFVISGAFSKTYAENKFSIGTGGNHFVFSPSANYCPGGYFGTSRLASNFDFDNEEAYQLSVGYDFSDMIQGLSTRLTHTLGKNISDRTGLEKENETDLIIAYDSPDIPGLSANIEDAYYHNNSGLSEYFRERPQEQRWNDFRVWVSYHLALS